MMVVVMMVALGLGNALGVLLHGRIGLLRGRQIARLQGLSQGGEFLRQRRG